MAVSEQQHEVRQANLPPQDLDAEESVLGAMMVSPNAISIVAEVLGPEDFYRRAHGQIYDTIRAMSCELVGSLAGEAGELLRLLRIGGFSKEARKLSAFWWSGIPP